MSRRTKDEDFDTRIDILRTRLKDSDDKNVQDAVFDRRTLMDLYSLASKGVIDSLGGSVCTGKEANIFRAMAGEKELALKIYRISTSNFNSMQDYLQGDIVSAWTRKEFRNLSRAEEVGIPVPHPIAMKENILVMDLIVMEGQVAPTLKDMNLEQEEARAVYEQIVHYISLLYNRAQLVHADLSEFNILYRQEGPVIIDMGQSVTLDHPQARRFLERDIANVSHYFRKKYSLGSPEEIWKKLIKDRDEIKEKKAD
ncbi:MAG: serine protein kinase RIO [Methanothrix sp.]|nr:serine protein kinase RIO [Methanothrix sp.]OYV10084.1 MAG: RIO kinase 1 [Methanosaeta sp. NSP1]